MGIVRLKEIEIQVNRKKSAAARESPCTVVTETVVVSH